jgi:RND family efflux transporter MFP subunit
MYIIVFLLSMTIVSCANKEKVEDSPEKYVVVNPIQADSSYNQEFVAEIQSIQNVELRARAKGFLERIYVDEGKSVSKGQLLFSLNSSEYQQEIAKAKAQLAAALAELKQIEVDIKNTKTLLEKNIVSKSELEVAQAKREVIMANIKEAEANISLANINLSFTDIRAPFSGVINRIPNKVGALVDEGTLLTTISNNNEMFAYFNVTETDYLSYMTKTNDNKKVSLKLANGMIFPYDGVIETIDSEIDQSTGNLSFRAKFPNPDKLLKHGASGKVLVKKELKNAILIPQKSTFEIQGNIYVFVVSADGTVQQRQIIPTARLSQMYVITPTLKIHDKIIYEGIQKVKDGDKVLTETISFSKITNN